MASDQILTRHVTQQYTQTIDRKRQGCSIFLDLKKACDCVNHKILLAKLYVAGRRIMAHALLKDYLTDRQQKVKVGETFSRCSKIETGVPQGNSISPLLFILIHINDPFEVTKAELTLFADDTHMYVEAENMITLGKKHPRGNKRSQILDG